MKKSIRSVIALVLALAISFSLLSVAALAAEPFNLLCIGDSTSQGYMVDDYIFENCGLGDNTSRHAYPFVMKDYLTEKLGRKVDLYNYTLTGMRLSELYAILFPDAERDVFCMETIDSYERAFAECYGTTTDSVIGSANIYTAFDEAIRKADVITLDAGMNYFGNYLGVRMKQLFGLQAPHTVAYGEVDHYTNLIAQYCPEMGAQAEALRLKLRALLANFDAEIAESLIDSILYAYGSFIVNMSRCVDRIYELNDDVELIICGIYSGVDETELSIDGMKLSLGLLTQPVFDSMDFYVTAINSHRHQYKFAPIDNDVELFIDEIQTGEMNPWTVDALVSMGRHHAPGLDQDTLIATCVKASNHTAVDPFELVAALQDQDTALEHALRDYDNATDGEQALLYFYLLMLAGNSFGTHPSLRGCAQKAEAIKRAYNCDLDATGTMIVKAAVDTTVFAVKTTTSILSKIVTGLTKTVKKLLRF